MTTLLIDGDILAFQAAAATEVATKWDDDMWTLHASEADGQRHIKDALVSIQNATGCKVMRVFLTGKKNYRTEILGTYKGNRKDTRKPMTLGALKGWLIDEYDAELTEPYEADDLIGIAATDDTETIIVSEDKDFLCVPCRLYNPRHSDRGVVTVSLDMADRYFYSQVLTGDASDNYKGCPQVGPVKADKILDAAEADYWPAVVTAFEKAGLCVDDALVQARCARILRVGDLIPYQEEPPLWTPP
jgi:DNA polymerase-1|tara:strand:- start:183 stop:917 length:735 start_codon:yes stop_codon:yes gene_type:complete